MPSSQRFDDITSMIFLYKLTDYEVTLTSLETTFFKGHNNMCYEYKMCTECKKTCLKKLNHLWEGVASYLVIQTKHGKMRPQNVFTNACCSTQEWFDKL